MCFGNEPGLVHKIGLRGFLVTTARKYQRLAPFLIAVLVAATSLWTYHASTENGFVWDTRHYIHNHIFWISRLGFDHIVWMFLSLEFSNWHPLTWISWAVDYQLYGGLDSWGYHFSNNVIHSINSTLVFVLTLVLFALNKYPSGRFSILTTTDALIAAGITATLFAVHPQHVESVAWVAERKDLLCQMFMLSSMLAYIKYTCGEVKTERRWLEISLGFFFLAILSKPMAVTFPLVLLLLDVFPLQRTKLTWSGKTAACVRPIPVLLKEKIPFFLLSAFLVLLTLLAQQQAMADIPYSLRFLNASNSIIFYLTRLFVPLQFAPHYPYFIENVEEIGFAAFLPFMAVLGVSSACLYAWKRGRHVWLVAWLFYLITLVPVLGLIQVGLQGAADRYTYFPTLPVYLLIGAGIFVLLKNGSMIRKPVVVVASLLLVLLLADKTNEQIQVWQDEQTLWSHQLEIYPHSIYGNYNLGVALFDVGNYRQSVVHMERDWQRDPLTDTRLAYLGLSYMIMQRNQEALSNFKLLSSRLDVSPSQTVKRDCLEYNIGWLYIKNSMPENARKHFRLVQPGSAPGTRASIWLKWLKNTDLNSKALPNYQELPAFCKALLT